MEIDVNISKSRTIEPLMTISAGSYSNNSNHSNNNNNNNNNRNNNNNTTIRNASSASASASPSPSSSSSSSIVAPTTPIASVRRTGCCGILSRLLCVKSNTGKTASSSSDYNNLTNSASCVSTLPQTTRKKQNRRTPQEIYLESRGKSCKKLLKFNGHSNKILLYPEEGWARTASSSYWTITPCWWQPNRCHIEEFSGTQRNATKAKMLPLEQKGSLLIAGHFTNTKPTMTNNLTSVHSFGSTGIRTISGSTPHKVKSTSSDEFKLYLSSNISMEDYNMGYCLTGFVERRCQQTNSFQMTHFAVIKRQWPSIGNNGNDAKTT